MYVFELFQFKTRENVCEREGDKMWNELRTWWRDYLEHVKSQPKGDNLQNQGQLLVYTETKFKNIVFLIRQQLLLNKKIYMTMKVFNS